MKNKRLFLSFVLLTTSLSGCLVTKKPLETVNPITNFEECMVAGNAIMESYPRQCRDGEGNLYVEEIKAQTDDLILDNPKIGQKISSPLKITGQARGTWYFEASFPVILTDWDGIIIAQGIAQAQGDWMTENFVPFEATLEFEANTKVSDRGTLILQKDNPSGLPENDDAVELTVFFQ